MNKELRKFLIDNARLRKEVTYTEVAEFLGLTDLGDPGQNRTLASELGAVAAYEDKYNRPLISAIVLYKNWQQKLNPEDYHGIGFFNIASELGKGSRRALIKKMYGIEQMTSSFDFWSDEKKYLEFSKSKIKSIEPTFFTKEDFQEYQKWAGQDYDKDDESHKNAVTYIKENIAPKVDYWASNVVEKIDDLEYDFDYRWIGNNSTFKKYTWARIFRKGNKDRHIFFTVEINGFDRCLKYKLDFNFSQKSPLSNDDKKMLQKGISASVPIKKISDSIIDQDNWESLITQTVKLITEYLPEYDRQIMHIWEIEPPSKDKSTKLSKQAPPDPSLMNQLPEDDFSSITTDYSKAARNRKLIGDAGEVLVLKFEREKLYKNTEEKGEVRQMKDGNGYDIFSKFEDGRDKYIEVKTTSKSKNEPFYISRRERNFARMHKENYVIYRLYNFDINTEEGLYYEITDLEETLDFQPTEYRATLKK